MQELKANPDARLIAGATELGLDITKRYKKFSTLISTEAVVELKEIKATETEWRIGAAVALTEIKNKLGEEFPMLGDMLRVFGSRQIRNRATMGGNLVTASPIGDSAPCLLALEAKVILARGGDAPSPEGGSAASTLVDSREEGVAATSERTLPIGEFFLAYRKTALQPGEILKTI
ncbi:MAG: FAD binding domain-containing protein [Limisphaerales bacterium]